MFALIPLFLLMKTLFIITLGLILCSELHAESAEIEVQLIPLAAPLDGPEAQLSGLDWCGDELLLLPQKPRFVSNDLSLTPSVFSLPKSVLLDAVKNGSQGALSAQPIGFNDNALRAGFFGFDGYEAIVCNDDAVWLAIETKVEEKFFTTNIVKANKISADQIDVHYDVHTTIESDSGIWNFSNETLLLAPDALISIHEANGTREKPQATAVSLITGKQKKIAMLPVPYRITDATQLDEQNRFWVINYRWQDDQHLGEDSDWIADKYPLGPSHKLEKNVERLVEFELTESGILRTETPPIYLKLTQEEGRNWEGIARLDELGFLLVSDEYPTTYFGFVPLP